MSDFHLHPSYGKQSVPVFKLTKEGNKHFIHDLVVQIILEGNIADSWLTGDNHSILPTETQKNTCYALALTTKFTCSEEYGKALAADILKRHKHIEVVNLQIQERFFLFWFTGFELT